MRELLMHRRFKLIKHEKHEWPISLTQKPSLLFCSSFPSFDDVLTSATASHLPFAAGIHQSSKSLVNYVVTKLCPSRIQLFQLLGTEKPASA